MFWRDSEHDRNSSELGRCIIRMQHRIDTEHKSDIPIWTLAS